MAITHFDQEEQREIREIVGGTPIEEMPEVESFTDSDLVPFIKVTGDNASPVKSAAVIKATSIGGGSGGREVTGVKGDSESSYRKGNVNITKANIGLGNVDDKSSATLKGEIMTGANVKTALGCQQGGTKYLKEDGSWDTPAGGGGVEQIQSDWNQTNTSAKDYIKNKPTSMPANGGDAATVNNHSVEKDVPSDAVFTDHTYSVMGASGSTHASGLVPDTPTTAGTSKFLREDGEWATPPSGGGGNTADVNYDTTNKKITKTIDGTTSDVVTVATLKTDMNLAKGDVGLGNVVNTGDSATPVSGGTTKFTTGGAYTELAKKVDKTTTVNNHALSGNVSITKSDVGLGNVGNFKAVSTEASQGLSDTEKNNARTNIGAGTSSFSGSYNDLTNKPTIPCADKSYAPLAHSGLGRKNLELKDGGSNILTQEDFDQTNTIYVIGYDFDLGGDDIQIPESCVLEFKGGSFSNGKLLSNSTEVVGVLPEGNNIYQGVFYKNGKPLNYNFKETKPYSHGVMSGFITPGEKLNYNFYPQSILCFYYNNKKYFLIGGNTDTVSPETAHIALFDEYFDYIGSALVPGYTNHGGGLAICDNKLYLASSIRTNGDRNSINVFSLSHVMEKCIADNVKPHPYEYDAPLDRLDYIQLEHHCVDIDYDDINEEFAVTDGESCVHIYDKNFRELRYFYVSPTAFLNENFNLGATSQGVALKNGVCYLSYWMYDAFTGGTSSGNTAIVQYDTIKGIIVDVQIIKSPYTRSETEGLCKDPDDDNTLWYLYGMYFQLGSYVAITKVNQVDTVMGIDTVGGGESGSTVSSSMSVEYYVDNTYNFSNGYSTGQSDKPFKSIETAIVMSVNNGGEAVISIKNTNVAYGCGPIKFGHGRPVYIASSGATINLYGRWWCYGGILKLAGVNIISNTDIAIRVGNNGYVYLDNCSISVSNGGHGIYSYENGNIMLDSSCSITGGDYGIWCKNGILRLLNGLSINNSVVGLFTEYSGYYGNEISFNGCGTALKVRYTDFKARHLYFTGCTTCFDIDDSKIQVPGEGHVTIDTCTTVAFKNTTWRNPSNILKTIYSITDFNTIVDIVKKGEVSNTAIGFVVTQFIDGLEKGEYYYNGSCFINKGSGVPVTLSNANKTLIPSKGKLSDMPTIPGMTIDSGFLGVRFFNTDINKYMYWNGNYWVVEGGIYTKLGELTPASTSFNGHPVTVSSFTYTSTWKYWSRSTIYRRQFEMSRDVFNPGDVIAIKIKSAQENYGCTFQYVTGSDLKIFIDYGANSGFNQDGNLGQVPVYSDSDVLQVQLNCDTAYFDGKIEIYKVE